MKLPRVLLVEDDPSIRRFVAMALQDLPIQLLEAATLADARWRLDEAPVRLLLCDLMLPDGSGVDLLQSLATDPERRSGAHLVAFSAGISAERRQQLMELGVDEVLSKPVSLVMLEACVERALAGAAEPLQASDDQAAAVDRFFAGDASLFKAYRDSCHQQFANDLRLGDAARASGDLAALRRLAHSLKTVLQTVGDAEASRLAAKAEADAARGDPQAAFAAWDGLRPTLLSTG